MRKVGLIGAVVVGAAVLSAPPISVNLSATQSQNKALAAVGKPLSAGSVAGVPPTRATWKSSRHPS
jgi:hypothetical protein